jgi:hypothetical protein
MRKHIFLNSFHPIRPCIRAVWSDLKDVSKMRKALTIFVIILILVSATVFVVHYGLFGENKETKPFYVGVTYCGNSTEEAKTLIDRVKSYTNLFVLQSGPLQKHPDDITEICDYAVSSGMYFVVYFGDTYQPELDEWLETDEGWWDDRFLGVYYGDEPAGIMLDGTVIFENVTGNSVLKGPGMVSVIKPDGASINYSTDGRIMVNDGNGTELVYESNGEIMKIFMSENGTTPQLIQVPVDPSEVESYEDLCNANPFLTHESTTKVFVDDLEGKLEYLHEKSVTTFTSDYALYWFDYLSGYDVVMAQVGWNHTIEQDIALVRGAANLQNKKWGAIITWKYNKSPYLDSGEAIFDQMRTAYEAGAEYVVIFNYAEDMTGPYGTLQNEHFDALERFWNEVVRSSAVKQGSIEAEAVLVLPENYGWGMRDSGDKIWGLWGPDEKSQQIWALSRNLLDQYGLGLDIVYDDPEFTVAEKYPQIYYWNHTG